MYYNMKMKTTQRNLAQMLQYLTSDREKILRIPHERLKSLYHMVKEVRFKVFMLHTLALFSPLFRDTC